MPVPKQTQKQIYACSGPRALCERTGGEGARAGVRELVCRAEGCSSLGHTVEEETDVHHGLGVRHPKSTTYVLIYFNIICL